MERALGSKVPWTSALAFGGAVIALTDREAARTPVRRCARGLSVSA